MPNWKSEVVSVMFYPTAAYRELAGTPAAPSLWRALRRAVFLAVLIGCCLSITTSGRLTLRLIVSSSILWSFAPALQCGAAIGVIVLLARGRLALLRALELYFAGIGPWSLWLLALAATGAERYVVASAAVPLLWSGLVTRGFLRALGLERARLMAGFLLHALLMWGPVLLFFLLSDQLAPRIGLLARL